MVLACSFSFPLILIISGKDFLNKIIQIVDIISIENNTKIQTLIKAEGWCVKNWTHLQNLKKKLPNLIKKNCLIVWKNK